MLTATGLVLSERSKTINRVMRIWIFSRTILATVALGCLIVIGLRDFIDPYNDASFSTGKWSSRRGADRAPMVKDLLENYLHVGQTKAEVKKLLGDSIENPPSRIVNLEGVSQKVESWTFSVGSWVLGGVGDDDFLELLWDQEDRLLRAKIIGY